MTGTTVMQENDTLTLLAEKLGEALKAAGQTVTAAESCTGGGIAEAFTRIAGSSVWFQRSWVTYSNEAKQQELGVPAEAFVAEGAVSETVVRAMAEGAQQKAGADWAVAVSGIAGPDGGSEAKPVGTVWLAWAGPAGTMAECCHFNGHRLTVRRKTIAHALEQLLLQMGVASN